MKIFMIEPTRELCDDFIDQQGNEASLCQRKQEFFQKNNIQMP